MEAIIIAGIASARQLIMYLVQMATLAGPDQITPEQLQNIINKASGSDAAWDAAVDAARDRIGNPPPS